MASCRCRIRDAAAATRALTQGWPTRAGETSAAGPVGMKREPVIPFGRDGVVRRTRSRRCWLRRALGIRCGGLAAAHGVWALASRPGFAVGGHDGLQKGLGSRSEDGGRIRSAAGAASRLERCTEKERSSFDATIMPYVSEAWLQDEAEIASGGVGQGGFGTASFELTGLAPREPVLVVTSEFRRKVNGHCRQVWRGVESQMHTLRISSGGTGCAYVAKVSGR